MLIIPSSSSPSTVVPLPALGSRRAGTNPSRLPFSEGAVLIAFVKKVLLVVIGVELFPSATPLVVTAAVTVVVPLPPRTIKYLSPYSAASKGLSTTFPVIVAVVDPFVKVTDIGPVLARTGAELKGATLSSFKYTEA